MLKIYSLTRFTVFILPLLALQACNGIDPAPEIYVSPTQGLITSESGTEQQFSIVLATQPKSSVTIDLRSSNENEGSIGVRNEAGNLDPVTSVVFTTGDWFTKQTIVITGVDDSVEDGDIPYTIITDAAQSGDSDYNGMNPRDVDVVNEDNEGVINNPGTDPNVVVSPNSGLTTSESQAFATFTVRLNSAPTANVTITATSDNSAEGVVTSNDLIFTSNNWNIAQTVTVIGVNDDIDDDAVNYTVNLTATSVDQNYNNFTITPVSVTNQDDDVTGVSVLPTTQLLTSEDGTVKATFTVALTSQPTGNVVITADNSSAIGIAEGSVSPLSATFSSANWNQPQAFTVTGIDDGVVDGDKTYTIGLSSTSTVDTKYDSLVIASVIDVKNLDNNGIPVTPGVAITPPVGGLVTAESGTSALVKVKLLSAPTANVTIATTSSNNAEAIVTSTNLIFTTTNWQVEQSIAVLGVDDSVDDDDQAYSINLTALSSDPVYNGFTITPISAINQDDDVTGVSLLPTTQLVTSENGTTTATFTVALTSQPIGDVVITPENNSVIGIAEGVVSPISATFTSTNWNQPQTFTVTGIDDGIADGDQTYAIGLSSASTNDAKYNSLIIASAVNVKNLDIGGTPATPGITVTPPIGGLVTSEDGTAGIIKIKLNSLPTADVTVATSSSDTTEGTVLPANVTFTVANWDIEQSITVTGQDDAIDDDDIIYTINLSSGGSADSVYAGLSIPAVTATNQDNDVTGVTLLPTTQLVTSENGTTTATFTVALTSQPIGDVVITAENSSPIGIAEGIVSPISATFTSTNWNQPQTFTITGIDDGITDGDQIYTIGLSSASTNDAKYNSLVISSVVNVKNLDIGGTPATPGVTVTPPIGGLMTAEDGMTGIIKIRLDSAPNANVIIAASSSDDTEGTILPASLTFTTTNWDTEQSITVTGQDDAIDDGDIAYTIDLSSSGSADTIYAALTLASVPATNQDDDVTGVAVLPTTELLTSEDGTTSMFTVALTSQPLGNVIITAENNSVIGIAEGSVAPLSVTFTELNWNQTQTFTVTGIDDGIVDGDKTYAIGLSSASPTDAKYDSLIIATVVNVKNQDIGSPATPAIIVSPPAGGLVTAEDGTAAIINIKLNSAPTADVTIVASSNNSAEGSVTSADLVFTTTNWNIEQPITVTGQDDSIDDGDVTYAIDLSASGSADSVYAGLTIPSVPATNLDNDVTGVNVLPTTELITSENGTTTATFTVELTSQPLGDVVITADNNSVIGIAEGSVSPSSVTFTDLDWNQPQTFTVTGIDDAIVDGDQTYAIGLSSTSLNDSTYNSLVITTVVNVKNLDIGVGSPAPGVTVTPTSGLVTSENGTTATFTVVLNTMPLSSVDIYPPQPYDETEGMLTPPFIPFDSTNWNIPQTFTVTGQDDLEQDGDITYTIPLIAGSFATDYDQIPVDSVQVTNRDNDTPGVTITPLTGLQTSEDGSTATFTVVLNSPPVGEVDIFPTSDNPAEGLVTSIVPLIFNAANWDIPQTVTIMGQNDFVADADVIYHITFSAQSFDTNYETPTLTVPSVEVTNINIQ